MEGGGERINNNWRNKNFHFNVFNILFFIRPRLGFLIKIT